MWCSLMHRVCARQVRKPFIRDTPHFRMVYSVARTKFEHSTNYIENHRETITIHGNNISTMSNFTNTKTTLTTQRNNYNPWKLYNVKLYKYIGCATCHGHGAEAPGQTANRPPEGAPPGWASSRHWNKDCFNSCLFVCCLGKDLISQSSCQKDLFYGLKWSLTTPSEPCHVWDREEGGGGDK